MTIAISGINATDNPGPGVPVARSLKESNSALRIIGLSYDAHDPGNYMNFVIDKSYPLPYPTKGWQSVFTQLQKIRATTGMQYLIPCLDVELPLYIRYQNELAQNGIRTFLPTETQFALRAKDKLSVLSKEIGIEYPETFPVYSVNELHEVIEEHDLQFPLVVKGNHYKAYIVYNSPAAAQKAIEIASEWGFPILLQKAVSGTEINLIGLGDGEGEMCGMVAIKKMATTAIGKVWTAVTIDHPGLKRLAEQFVRGTRWRGPFELECIQSGNDLYLIEINPRFPAWVYFATAAGVNLPARLLQLMNGHDCMRDSPYTVGKYLVRYTYELITDIEDYFKLATVG